MASPDCDSPWLFSTGDSFGGCFNMRVEGVNSCDILNGFQDHASSVSCNRSDIPKPPPLPDKSGKRRDCCNRKSEYFRAAREVKHMWERLFREGYGADVHIVTDGNTFVPAHSIVLGMSSPVLENVLQQLKVKNGIRYMKIHGVPDEAVFTFIRFIYSYCYEAEEIQKYVLHLLVLAHSYSVPSLKRVCVNILERGWLNNENVIDVLQLSRNCDAPRLSLFCVRMVVNDFKSICSTEGWKVMKRVNPALEQELVESVVEADSRKQERARKSEEKKVYVQLNEAMEALLHICRDGCRTIGPRDKVLKGSLVACNFAACKGLEALVRHFSNCKARVPGGCAHCKRMWQLLELHSRMCNEPESCKVPLCRHFKEKMQQQSKKEEAKWKLLVCKVIAAKKAFSAHGEGLL